MSDVENKNNNLINKRNILIFSVFAVIIAAVIFVVFLKKNDDPLSCDNYPDCTLTIATIGDYFVQGDTDGVMSLGPSGITNREDDSSVFLHWIRKLLYPSLVAYIVDEFNHQEMPTEYFSGYRSIHLDLDGKKSIDPGFVTREEQSSDFFRFRVDFSPKSDGFLCSDGAPINSPHALKRPVMALRENIARQGVIEDDIKLYFDEESLLADISTQTGGNDVVYDLLLGHINLFRVRPNTSNQFVPCGIFNFAQDGVDAAQQNVDLEINHRGYGFLPDIEKSCCIKNDGSVKVPKFCFRRYTSDSQAISKDAKFDILISSYNPFKKHGEKKPDEIIEKTLPVGTHFFAVINAQSIQDKNERLFIYKEVFTSAVREIIRKGIMEVPEEDISPYWFPYTWSATRNIEKNTEITDYKYTKLESPVISFKAKPVKILVVGSENPAEQERNPLLKAIIENFKNVGVIENQIKIIAGAKYENNWNAADIVLFTSKYDPLFGDPTSLILSHSSNIRKLSPGSNSSWEQKLKSASRRILLTGLNSKDVLHFVAGVQKEFVEDAFIFPIFTIPYHVFFRQEIFSHIEMNYREGFVNFDKWRMNIEGRCASGVEK